MKRPMLVFASLLAATSLLAAQDPAADARAATAAFGQALKSELMSALQNGGPLAAIGVCHSEAPAIASAVSLEQGVTLSRVSLKNRNPSNAPNAWQRKVLESFEQRRAAGEDPAALTWQETVSSEAGAEFRFMKAIPTGGLCLQCHGKDLAPEVTAKLAELYPQDKATGYSTGDLRGAFVVTRELPGS